MNWLKHSSILLCSLFLMAPFVSALAIQPEDGTSFDTLSRNCQQAFPMRQFDSAKTTAIVVEKSNFCLFVLQRDRRGNVVATFATATSLGRDMIAKNGKYRVSSIAQRSVVQDSDGRAIDWQNVPNGDDPNFNYRWRRRVGSYPSYRSYISISVDFQEDGKSYQRRNSIPCGCQPLSFNLQGNQDPSYIGGLIWRVPGVSLRRSDAVLLIYQIRASDPAYVVNRLSDIGL